MALWKPMNASGEADERSDGDYGQLSVDVLVDKHEDLRRTRPMVSTMYPFLQEWCPSSDVCRRFPWMKSQTSSFSFLCLEAFVPPVLDRLAKRESKT